MLTFKHILDKCKILTNLSKKIRFFSAINSKVNDEHSYLAVQTLKQWDQYQKRSIQLNYGIHSETDAIAIMQKYKKHRYKLTLNEEIVFLKTFSEANIFKEVVFDINRFPVMASLLFNIKTKLKNASEEYPLIGSLQNALDKLKLYKDSELWLISSDYILDGRMNASFEELLETLQSFSNILKVADKNYISGFFLVLEHLIINQYASKTIPLKDLVNICNKYAEIERHNCQFMDILHSSFSEHLSTNLKIFNVQQKENFKDLIKLSYNFAHWKIIDLDTVLALQDIVEYLIGEETENQFKNTTLTPEILALVICSLGVAKIVKNIPIKHRIIDLLKKRIANNSVNYRLADLANIHKYLSVLDPDGYMEFVGNILHKKATELDSSQMNLIDVQNYINTRVLTDFDELFSKFPEDILFLLDKICTEKLESFLPSEVYNFFVFMESTGLKSSFPNFFARLPGYIVQKIAAFDFEQMCYLYYIYMRDGKEYNTIFFKENTDILKDYILMYYSSIPRGKLDINSYFYKILEVVDINKFYMKGEY